MRCGRRATGARWRSCALHGPPAWRGCGAAKARRASTPRRSSRSGVASPTPASSSRTCSTWMTRARTRLPTCLPGGWRAVSLPPEHDERLLRVPCDVEGEDDVRLARIHEEVEHGFDALRDIENGVSVFGSAPAQ